MAQYGKIVNGILQYAPNKITVEDSVIYNPKVEELQTLGYKIILQGEMPAYQQGYHTVTYYTETANSIVENYRLEKDPESEENPDDLFLEMLADHEERICLIELGGLEDVDSI